MESIGVGPWIAIAVAVGAIGVLVGYWLGTRMGGHNTEPMRELNREHNAYKEDVREHFEQVSATMTRMVEDYREMYHHVAKGAEKLADMHHETVIEPPPKPEAITQDLHEPDTASRSAATEVQTTKTRATETEATEPQTAHKAPAIGKPDSAAMSATKTRETKTDAPASAGTSGSSTGRPQDAAIHAAAEDAASKRGGAPGRASNSA